MERVYATAKSLSDEFQVSTALIYKIARDNKVPYRISDKSIMNFDVDKIIEYLRATKAEAKVEAITGLKSIRLLLPNRLWSDVETEAMLMGITKQELCRLAIEKLIKENRE